MKRLFAIGLSVLMLVGFSAHAAYELSDSNKQKYLDWIKKHGHGWSYALAVAPNYGCGWYDSGNSIYEAKRKSLSGCKKFCKTTCEIKDVDGKSAFIKQRSSSSYSSNSSSTASSSTKVWCATKDSVTWISKNYCRQEGGKSYSYKTQAKAEHKRLKKSSSTASSSGDIWCATKYSVRWISRYSCAQDKGKAFNKYSSALAEKKRLNKSSSSYSTASSSGEIWCATANSVTNVSRTACKKWNGKTFSSKYQAEAEHTRLKGSSSSSYSSTASSSGKYAYCYAPSTNFFYKSNRFGCGSSDREISYQEYSQGTLNSTSTITASSSGSGNVWCASRGIVDYRKASSCKARGGKGYSSIDMAHAEHNRLKGSSSSYSSTASSSSSIKGWCARIGGVRYEDKNSCTRTDGKWFTKRSSAENKRKQLKAASTPVIKTASLTIRSNVNGDSVYIDGIYKGSTRLDLKLSKGRHTIRIEKDGYKTYEESINLTDNLIIRGHLIKIVDEPVKTFVVDNTVEVEFWNSIKGSDDPDEYRIYLDEYPTGKFAKLAKLRMKKLGGTSTSVAQSSIPDLNYGDYYALVIGNNDYELLPDLETAVNDATKVASVLEYDYGFKVELLKNASRGEILKSLFGYRKIVGERDNLLIYYAGHGELDEGAKKGYWLPVDAARDDPSNWVMTDQVVAQITAMEAKHVMVVADSCFSGELTRGIKIDYGSPNWVQKLVKKKARIALTSGGLEPVSDSGGGSHSVFAKVFISLLEENTGVLNTQKLFSELRPRVMKNTRQTPEHGTIHLAGDDGGDFLFVRQ